MLSWKSHCHNESLPENIFPTFGQSRSDISCCGGVVNTGHVSVARVTSSSMVSEVAGGLDHHEHHQAQQHKQEGNQEAVEPDIVRTDLKYVKVNKEINANLMKL